MTCALLYDLTRNFRLYGFVIIAGKYGCLFLTACLSHYIYIYGQPDLLCLVRTAMKITF